MQQSSVKKNLTSWRHRWQTPGFLLIFAALLLALMPARAEAATSTNSGTWFDGSIWNTRVAPTNAGDSATILTTVTLPYLAGIPAISLSDLTLAGGGSLGVASPERLSTVSAVFQGGHFSGVLSVAGSLVCSGANNSFSSSYITNSGAIQFQDTNVVTISASHFEVLPGANFEFQTDGGTVNGYIDSWSLVRKSGGTGRTWLNNTTLNDYGGTVEADSGWLVLGGGTSLANTTFIVGDGAVIDVTGAALGNPYPNDWSGLVTGSGPGQVLLRAGTVNGTTALNLNFPSNVLWWTGGSVSGGPITNLAAINLYSTNGPTLGTALYNAGQIRHTNAGSLSLSSYRLINLPSGTYDWLGDGGTTGGTMENWGQLRKLAGTGNSSLGSTLNNYGGTLQVDAGRIQLSGGGTLSNATVAIAGGAEISVNSSMTWLGQIAGTGAGDLWLNSSGIALPAAGASLNFPSNFFWWTGGTLSSTAGTNFGVLHLHPTNSPTLSGTIYNAGWVRQSSTGNLGMTAAHIENLPGATYEMAGDGGTINGYIDNWGLVRKSAGTGNSVLNNTTVSTFGGTVAVDSGRLVIAGGSSNYNATFLVAGGAVLDVAGGYSGNSWAGQVTGSGAGTVLLPNGAVNSGASLAFNFPTNLFWWTGGTMGGSTATNIGVITLFPTNGPIINGIFQNAGVLKHVANGTLSVSSSRLQNLASGQYELAGDGNLSGGYLDNWGLLRKSAGAGTSSIGSTLVNRGGSIEVDSGTLAIGAGFGSTNGTYSQLAGTTLTLAAGISLNDTFNVGNNATLSVQTTFTNPIVNAAAGAQIALQNSTFSNATLNLAAGAQAEITAGNNTASWAGIFGGSGSGTVLLRNGQIYGRSSYTLNFSGNLFQFTGGTLNGPAGGALTNLGVINVFSTNQANTYQVLYNYGLIRQTGTNSLLIRDAGYPIENMPGGTVELASDAGIAGNTGNGLLDNWGLLRKSGGLGVSTVSATFTNHGGAIRVDSGTLSLNSQTYLQSGGALSITISGTNAGQWGQPACGFAVLGGPLNVAISNSTSILPGALFPIVSGTNRVGIFTATNAPAGVSVVYTATGVYLTVTNLAPTKLLSPQVAAGNFNFGFQSSIGQGYTVWHNDNLTSSNWVADTNLVGNGQVMPISLPLPGATRRFYRVSEP